MTIYTMTFTKEVLTNYHSQEFGNFENCNLYKLYDKDSLIGKFIVSPKVAFLMTNEDKYRIDITNHFFKSNEYEIIDIKNEVKIGFYTLSTWRIGWREIGTLTLNNEKYFCKRQKAEIRNNIFKKATWGHFKLSLSNHLTEVVYNLKVDTNWIESANSEFRNAEGKVKFSQADTMLILTGLFFIERMLDINDTNSA